MSAQSPPRVKSRTRDTQAQVHCLEPGVVFVSYEGNPDITPIAEHDA